MSSSVSVRNLRKQFGDTRALQDVSFEVESGELFGFIGPDGGGKTTLFRTLVTLLIPDAGTARVLGLDVVRDLWKLRRRIALRKYFPFRSKAHTKMYCTCNNVACQDRRTKGGNSVRECVQCGSPVPIPDPKCLCEDSCDRCGNRRCDTRQNEVGNCIRDLVGCRLLAACRYDERNC